MAGIIFVEMMTKICIIPVYQGYMKFLRKRGKIQQIKTEKACKSRLVGHIKSIQDIK